MGLATQLPRLTRILEDRGAPTLTLLRAVETANESRYYMDISALSQRFTILLPGRADIFAHLAPGRALPELPPRPLFKVFGDGATLEVTVMSVGAVSAADAVTMAPFAVRPAWQDKITALLAFGKGRITSRLRSLDRPRATIDVLYEARPPADDARFAASIDEVASRLGVPPGQRAVAKAHHTAANGAATVVTAACNAAGPAPELAFMYGNTSWDEAVRLCRLVASEDAARGGAAVLGTLAATLEADTTAGVQLHLGPDGPDVSVLVHLK